jgi:diguanylate cyclase (GGDEF)-like protein
MLKNLLTSLGVIHLLSAITILLLPEMGSKIVGYSTVVVLAVVLIVLAESLSLFESSDIRILKGRLRTIEKIALTDALTGLLNRRGGEEFMVSHVARSRRRKAPISFVYIDIDHFKKINDNYGHKFGDCVLICIAGELQRKCRASDIVVRWGGEEFLLVLPDTDLSGAINLAQKLKAVLEAVPFPEDLKITASFGCAELGDDQVETALARADTHLYVAKAQGRNRVCPDHIEKKVLT